jgi:nucleotide-binding universal stress UspA family protein
MFERILVTLDGSEYGERALPYAARFAEMTGAQVTLLTVLEAADSERAANTTRSSLNRHVEAMAETGSEVTAAVRHGNPERQIIEAARELDADLLVMSTQGAGAGDRFELGHVALYVLRTAPCPIFTVRINRPAPPQSVAEERWQDEGGGNVA